MREVVLHLSPLLGAFLRVLIGFTVLFLTLIFVKIFSKRKQNNFKYKLFGKLTVFHLIIGIFLQALPFIFLFTAEVNLEPGIVGTLMAMVPLWTFILATIIGEKGNYSLLSFFASFSFCLFGITLIYNSASFNVSEFDRFFSLILVVLSTICYAIGTVLSKYVSNLKLGSMDSIQIVVYQHIGALVFISGYCIISGFELELIKNYDVIINNKNLMISLCYLGLFANALAWMIYSYLSGKIGSVLTSTVTYLVPGAALILDLYVYGSHITLYKIFGLLLIITGVVILNYKKILKFSKIKSIYSLNL